MTDGARLNFIHRGKIKIYGQGGDTWHLWSSLDFIQNGASAKTCEKSTRIGQCALANVRVLQRLVRFVGADRLR